MAEESHLCQASALQGAAPHLSCIVVHALPKLRPYTPGDRTKCHVMKSTWDVPDFYRSTCHVNTSIEQVYTAIHLYSYTRIHDDSRSRSRTIINGFFFLVFANCAGVRKQITYQEKDDQYS